MEENTHAFRFNFEEQAKKCKLSPRERRVIVGLAGLVSADDADFKAYTISAKDFAQLAGVPEGDAKTEAMNIADSLGRKAFLLEEAGNSARVHWFTQFTICDDTINFCINPFLKPYLSDLHDTDLFYIVGLTGKHSRALYEMLKLHERDGGFTLTADALKHRMGAETYRGFGIFKTRVLEPSIADINQRTDLHVRYEVLGADGEPARATQRVESVAFKVTANTADQTRDAQ